MTTRSVSFINGVDWHFGENCSFAFLLRIRWAFDVTFFMSESGINLLISIPARKQSSLFVTVLKEFFKRNNNRVAFLRSLKLEKGVRIWGGTTVCRSTERHSGYCTAHKLKLSFGRVLCYLSLKGLAVLWNRGLQKRMSTTSLNYNNLGVSSSRSWYRYSGKCDACI